MISKRLDEVWQDFFVQTEKKSKQVFDEQNKRIVIELKLVNDRLDEAFSTHKEHTRQFNELSKLTRDGIESNDKIEKIFKSESESFFLERHKWKTDAEMRIKE